MVLSKPLPGGRAAASDTAISKIPLARCTSVENLASLNSRQRAVPSCWLHPLQAYGPRQLPAVLRRLPDQHAGHPLSLIRAQRTGAALDQERQAEFRDPGVATASAVLSAIFTVLGIFVYAAPGQAGQLVYGVSPEQQDFLMVTFFKILSPQLVLTGALNWFQKGAAEDGKLGVPMHVRSSAALEVFSVASFALLFSGLFGGYNLNPAGAVPFAVVIVAQQLVAIQSFKVGTKAGGPLTILGAIRTLLTDLGRITQVSGVNSGLYSLFTATFIGSGLAFIFLPELTKAGMFGTTTPLSPEDLALWRVLGTTVAGIVAPTTSIQQEAAIQNNFSQRPKRFLMAVLALVSGAYTFTLLPILFTDKSGSLLFWAGFPWGTVAVASTLIAVKPKENEGWYTPW